MATVNPSPPRHLFSSPPERGAALAAGLEGGDGVVPRGLPALRLVHPFRRLLVLRLLDVQLPGAGGPSVYSVRPLRQRTEAPEVVCLKRKHRLLKKLNGQVDPSSKTQSVR